MRLTVRRAAVAVAVALLLALAASLAPRGEGLTESRRASPRAHLRVPSVSVASAADPDTGSALNDEPWPDLRFESLNVVLLDPSDARALFWPKSARLDPAAYWPLPDEGRLPDDALTEALEALIAWDVEVGHPLEREWIAAAEEILPSPPPDAGTALLALELARRAAAVDRNDAFRAASSTLRSGEQMSAAMLLGPPDTAPVEDAALALIEGWPDDPAADVARLYLLDAAVRAEAPEVVEITSDLLRYAEDPAVAAQAAGLWSRRVRGADDVPLAPDVLDAVGEVLDAAPDATPALEATAATLGAALRHGDPERSRRWADRYEDALLAACDADPDGSVCTAHRFNLDAVVGWLGDRAPDEASDWRQGLRIVAVRCADDRPLDHGVTATFDVGWRFGPWDPAASTFTRCFERGAREVPAPDGPMQVTIRVVGAGPRG